MDCQVLPKFLAKRILKSPENIICTVSFSEITYEGNKPWLRPK